MSIRRTFEVCVFLAPPRTSDTPLRSSLQRFKRTGMRRGELRSRPATPKTPAGNWAQSSLTQSLRSSQFTVASGRFQSRSAQHSTINPAARASGLSLSAQAKASLICNSGRSQVRQQARATSSSLAQLPPTRYRHGSWLFLDSTPGQLWVIPPSCEQLPSPSRYRTTPQRSVHLQILCEPSTSLTN